MNARSDGAVLTTHPSGLKAIAISHPHFYTTHTLYSHHFPNTPIHLAANDTEWLMHPPLSSSSHTYLEGAVGATKELVPSVTLIKAGGHFAGSLLLHWDGHLFLADTIMTVPSAFTPHPRPRGVNSYVFQWSIPNAIPLSPPIIMGIWDAVKNFDWHTTHGAFQGMDVHGHGDTVEEKYREMKGRVLESMKIQVRAEGHVDAAVLKEELQ
ncbi:MAG: hypothetical protein Q9162_000114 [Coniocarpon cinnabarinum]